MRAILSPAFPAPAGPNLVTGHEERFDQNYTYQIATQIDGLNHIGVDTTFYNGIQFADMVADHGTLKLGNETMPPAVTRGVVLDIVGLKLALGETTDVVKAPNGEGVLGDLYRITLSDIDAAMRRQRIKRFLPGDVIVFYTGWTHLVKDDPARYLAAQPGIYLAEARYLAESCPAIIGADTWGLEALDPAVTLGNLFPVHQVLLTQLGIRIGESFRTEHLVADNVFEFVIMVNPQQSKGATAGSTSPVALGVPNRTRPRTRIQRRSL